MFSFSNLFPENDKSSISYSDEIDLFVYIFVLNETFHVIVFISCIGL